MDDIADQQAYRVFADNLPTLCWIANADGYITWYNRGWHEYCGTTAAEIEGWGWAKVHDPDILPDVIRNWEASIATGAPFEMTFPLRRADGQFRHFLTRIRPERSAAGEVMRWYGVNIDIQDQINAESALRDLAVSLEQQVEERANQLAARTTERDRLWRSSQDLLISLDGHGTILSASPSATAILGWDVQEMVGKAVLDFVAPEDMSPARDALAKAALETLPITENRCRHKDGGFRWMSWVAAPAGDLIFATGRHITAQKEAQASLAAAQEALRQSQKMDAVGQLTGGVAHDFNNLLTIVRSSVDFLRRDDLPQARRNRYIDAISDTVDRATRLTSQLLAFARRQPLKPEIFDVGRKVADVANMVRPLVGERVVISIAAPFDTYFAEVDVGQFETSLVNLAVNARDAMQAEGPIVFSVEQVDGIPALRAHTHRPGAFIKITVKDAGTGIAEDQIEAIFEPFFTTKEVGKGTGLGLSQVFGFAKQSNGDVSVDSQFGLGSTFAIYLPSAIAGPKSDVFERSMRATHASGGGACVLVVEDNRSVGQFSTEMLHDLGYKTAWAATAHEALDLLGAEGGGFDLIFSDVIMPGMNGVDFAKTVRRRFPALPIVLTSGYSEVLATEGRHGFELIQKPYSVEALSHTLRTALASAQDEDD